MVLRVYMFILGARHPITMTGLSYFLNSNGSTFNMSITLTRLLDTLQFAAHSNDCVGRPVASNIIDPTSCNHFLMCSNTRTLRAKCPDNLFYDPEKDACEFPDKVDCVNGVRPTQMPTISNSASNATTISARSTVFTNTTTKTVKIPSNICNGIESGRQIADPVSCTHYYTCTFAGPVRRVCPPTLFYNREAKVCDFPRNVLCEKGMRPNVTITTATLVTSPSSSQSTEIPINLFTICQNATDNPTSTGVGNTGFVAHPASCIIFFNCIDGTVVERRQCLDGKYFNRDKRECVTGGPDSCWK